MIAVYGIINARIIKVTRKLVKLPHLPVGWQGKTVLWVSDLHLGQVKTKSLAWEVVNIAQALNPEMVFIGGDLFDGVKANFKDLAEPFSHLHPPKGIYFITGNHEEFFNADEYIEAVANAGITILNNQMVTAEGLQIIGVDYRDAGKPENFEKLLEE